MKSSGAALVTGAGARLGRAMSLALADAGYDIAIHYRSSKAQADEVVALIEKAGRKAVAVKADLSFENETAALVGAAKAALGPLRLLVNSASVFEHDDIETLTRQSWDAHIETNLRAPLKLTQDFARQAEAGKDNLVVNLIDQRVLKLTPQFLSYTVSKSALYFADKDPRPGAGSPRHSGQRHRPRPDAEKPAPVRRGLGAPEQGDGARSWRRSGGHLRRALISRVGEGGDRADDRRRRRPASWLAHAGCSR